MSVITSNLPLGEWDTIFKDETTTKAAVDRLVHHSTILRLNAESYRKESAQKRQEEISQKTPPENEPFYKKSTYTLMHKFDCRHAQF